MVFFLVYRTQPVIRKGAQDVDSEPEMTASTWNFDRRRNFVPVEADLSTTVMRSTGRLEKEDVARRRCLYRLPRAKTRSRVLSSCLMYFRSSLENTTRRKASGCYVTCIFFLSSSINQTAKGATTETPKVSKQKKGKICPPRRQPWLERKMTKGPNFRV